LDRFVKILIELLFSLKTVLLPIKCGGFWIQLKFKRRIAGALAGEKR